MDNPAAVFLPIVFAVGLTACPSLEAQLPADARVPTGSLKVSIPTRDVTVERGSTVGMSVDFDRPEGLRGPITVKVLDLPAGVVSEPITVPADSNQGSLSLHATEASTDTWLAPGVVEAEVGGARVTVPIQMTVTSVPADGSDVRATFSGLTGTGADTRPFLARTAYANFKRSLCQVMASELRRNIEVCLTKPFQAGGTYTLVDSRHFGAPGTASVTYFQTEQPDDAGNVADASAGLWDSLGGTLRLETVTSQALEFRVQDAVMVPATDFARNTATARFTLELSAHIEAVTNL